MKKLYLAIIIIIITLIVGIGVIYYRIKTNPVFTAINNADDIVNPEIAPNPESCANISGSQDKDDCYYAVAQKQLKPEYCTEIINDVNKNGCYSLLAQKMNDISVCDNIKNTNAADGSTKDMCLNAVATKLKDISICQKIGDASMKESCVKFIAPESIKKSLAIISPSVGQIFQRGDDITISWRGGANYIRVAVIPTSGQNKGILLWISNNSKPDSSITWNGKNGCKIPVDMSKCVDLQAGEYKVHIDEVYNPNEYGTAKENNNDIFDETSGTITLK